jgi:iron complex transport system substrate-binding protein
MRAVSFLPSATEMVFALGQGDQLLGRSHECDFPAEARTLPTVMRAREDFSKLTSSEINSRVKERMREKQDLYVLDETLLAKIAPDLLFTQDLCHVCSASPQSVQEAIDRLPSHPTSVVLSPRKLTDVDKDLQKVADALGVTDRGRTLRADIGRRIEAAGLASRQENVPPSSRPTVVVLEWIDPPIVGGLWIPEMIRAAGGSPVLSKAGAAGVETTWDALRGCGADLVVAAPCAFALDRTLGELRGPRPHPLEDLHPPRGVWAADEAFFARPGPRLVEGVELLSDLLHGPGRPRRSLEGRATPAFRSPLPAYKIPTRR